MANIKLKSDDTGVDVTFHAMVFKDLFADGSDISIEGLELTNYIWIDIKDDAGIIDIIVD